MPSDIDESVPADGVKAEKSQFRANFLAAKEEIEELQQQVDLAYRIAFDLGPTL